MVIPNADVMKKISYLLFLALICSCTEPVVEKEKIYSVAISQQELLFENNGNVSSGNNSIVVESSDSWVLSGKKTWCTPSIVEGKSGDVVTFEAEPNTDEDSRSTEFKFICGNKTAKLTIIQSATGVIDIYKSDFSVSRNGEEILVRILANNELTYSIDKNASSWIIPLDDVGTKSADINLYRFNVVKNEGYKDRTGYITFSACGMDQVVTIQQEKKIDLNPEKIRYDVSADGGTIKVNVSTNVAYTVSIPAYAADWLTHSSSTQGENEPDGLQKFEETFTVNTPQTALTRACTVLLRSKDGVISSNLVFVQKGSEPLMLNVEDDNYRQFLIDNTYVLCEEGSSMCDFTNMCSNVTSLNLNNKGIKSITGLSVFSNLTSLYCIGNYLKELNIDGTNINTLKADNNPIEKMVCGSAPLYDVNFSSSSYSNTKGLISPDGEVSTRLTVTGNNVQYVQVNNNSNLGFLDVYDCPKCSFLGISGCKSYMKVYVNPNFSAYIYSAPVGYELIKSKPE